MTSIPGSPNVSAAFLAMTKVYDGHAPFRVSVLWHVRRGHDPWFHTLTALCLSVTERQIAARPVWVLCHE
jgi:hypothetical protein